MYNQCVAKIQFIEKCRQLSEQLAH